MPPEATIVCHDQYDAADTRTGEDSFLFVKNEPTATARIRTNSTHSSPIELTRTRIIRYATGACQERPIAD
jgi:hypothetical protein